MLWGLEWTGKEQAKRFPFKRLRIRPLNPSVRSILLEQVH
jgi:hypothetical protein